MDGLHFGEDAGFIGLDSIKKGATGMRAVGILIS